MFERFTKDARDAVKRAQGEARDLGQSPIGTEHLLLALLTGGPVTRALAGQNIDHAYVRSEILRRVGLGPTPGTDARAEADAEDAAALKAIGIDLEQVRRAIEENFGPGALHLPRPPERKGWLRRRMGDGFTPFSPRAKKVLELSLREALRLKHTFIAPEHILLGMLREGNGLALLILTDAGADLGRLRDEVTRALNEYAA